MKGRLLDIIKWSLIIIVGAVAFYLVYPKYYFGVNEAGRIVSRGNKIEGKVEVIRGSWSSGGLRWKEIPETVAPEPKKKQ